MSLFWCYDRTKRSCVVGYIWPDDLKSWKNFWNEWLHSYMLWSLWGGGPTLYFVFLWYFELLNISLMFDVSQLMNVITNPFKIVLTVISQQRPRSIWGVKIYFCIRCFSMNLIKKGLVDLWKPLDPFIIFSKEGYGIWASYLKDNYSVKEIYFKKSFS